MCGTNSTKKDQCFISSSDWEFHFPLAILPTINRARYSFLKARYFQCIYQSTTHAIHMHDYEGQMYLNDRLIDLHPGDITISPANHQSSYHVKNPDGGWHYCIHFTINQQNGAPAESVCTMPLYFPQHDVRECEWRFKEIMSFFNVATESPATSFGAANALRQFLLWLSLYPEMRMTEDSFSTVTDHKIVLLEKYIISTLEQPLCVADLARKYHISQNYLAQMFRRKHGTSIQQYQLQRRISHAQYLLRSTLLSVKEVGATVGLSDPQYFNKRFRQITGCSPSEFRHSENN